MKRIILIPLLVIGLCVQLIAQEERVPITLFEKEPNNEWANIINSNSSFEGNLASSKDYDSFVFNLDETAEISVSVTLLKESIETVRVNCWLGGHWMLTAGEKIRYDTGSREIRYLGMKGLNFISLHIENNNGEERLDNIPYKIKIESKEVDSSQGNWGVEGLRGGGQILNKGVLRYGQLESNQDKDHYFTFLSKEEIVEINVSLLKKSIQDVIVTCFFNGSLLATEKIRYDSENHKIRFLAGPGKIDIGLEVGGEEPFELLFISYKLIVGKKEDEKTKLAKLYPYRGHLAFEISIDKSAIGKPHQIQYSTDNNTWQTIETITLEKETTVYLDKSGVGKPKRFYRATMTE